MASTLISPPHDSPLPPNHRAGRYYLAGIGLSLALLGSLFIWLMARSFLRAWEMRSWPEVPCLIISSELEERRHDQNSPIEYRHHLNFGYEWQGQRHVGSHLSLRGNPWSSKQEMMQGRLKDYPVGKITTCWVDPATPDLAVLKLDSLAPGYSIWFPSLFVIGGLGITYRAFSKRPAMRKS